MKRIDLHTHSTASDGTNSSQDNVALAKERGLQAIAITDHDTVSGVAEALEAGARLGVEVVPGIEISTLLDGQDIHILGYFVDYLNEDFLDELTKLRQVRNQRNQMMVDRLKELGIEITIEQVQSKQTKPGGNVGRPHIAEVLVDLGKVSSMEEAFEVYLGREGKAYVNPWRIPPKEGIELILRFGGVPVLAHPGLYDKDDEIEDFVEAGLQGIEVYHPDHSEQEVEKYEKLVTKHNLIATGGSDYHGVRNGSVYHGELGSQPVGEAVLEQLKARRNKKTSSESQ
ncbi:PHP domain-containing protein [Bacillus horti]|uniref:Metal-dependent phosphoesterase TrpH n=1 Tax=Caldalkalibacillus horti TaxID=77523 RepID=A0ABT9W4I8_9BACI|nr:PHP domain-containing protein [Bacillus horti]MDQ0168149.1 putative metal-dependent phosphoesterase TrpH [Bacillus horti]